MEEEISTRPFGAYSGAALDSAIVFTSGELSASSSSVPEAPGKSGAEW